MANKIVALERIVGKKLVNYKCTHSDANNKANGNLVLCFKGGEKLFISSLIVDKTSLVTGLFFSPHDLN